MTVEYPFSLAQLAQMLSALENERRNPNTKRNAIKAIERNAAQIGLTVENVFDAADGLLSGRLSAADWRAQLRDEAAGRRPSSPSGPAEPGRTAAPTNRPKPTSCRTPGRWRCPRSGTGDAAAADVAEATEDAPLATTDAVAANPETTEKRVGLKEQLRAACQAAEHWLQAERSGLVEQTTRSWGFGEASTAQALARRREQREPREPGQVEEGGESDDQAAG